VLEEKSVVAPYVAVIECVPTARALVEKVALPPLKVPVPIVVPPFVKVTVPAGVPEVKDFTVAVKVTVVPCVDGLSEDAKVVVVFAASTTCDTFPEALTAKSLAPA